MENQESMLAYYAASGVMTDLAAHKPFLTDLSRDLPELVRMVQGMLIHVFWAERYGRTLSEAEKVTLQVRPAGEKLVILRQANPAPLAQPRPLDGRQVGNCRDFSVLLTALLRHLGVPARSRCGFGAYFLPDHYEDHWVVQVWHPEQERWRWVDPQLDAVQQQALGIDFDPLDMPYHPNTLESKFIPAGEAYRICLGGGADPEKFGIFDMHGMDFIRGNVVRDFLALNKLEILPWDWGWGYLTVTRFADLALFGHLSALLATGDEAFPSWRALFENEPGLAQIPEPQDAALEVKESAETIQDA
jgi:hypothetical protein